MSGWACTGACSGSHSGAAHWMAAHRRKPSPVLRAAGLALPPRRARQPHGRFHRDHRQGQGVGSGAVSNLTPGGELSQHCSTSPAAARRCSRHQASHQASPLVSCFLPKPLGTAGRAKDTIVLSNGENVEPQPLEDLLSTSPHIQFAGGWTVLPWRWPGAEPQPVRWPGG